MITQKFNQKTRTTKLVKESTNLVVGGDGMTGVCADIAAARDGIKVILIQ